MKALELSQKYTTLLRSYGVNTAKRKAMFFSQLDHESGLKPIAENLNYSAERLLVVFPKYFKGDLKIPYTKKELELYNSNTKHRAVDFAHNPEKIANIVYANRMGNGNQKSGDGYRFRGRGFIQITGRNNYTVMSKDTRIDYLNNPDWLLREPDAMISALWFWQKNKLNEYANAGDVEGATRVINGGINGLTDRKKKYEQYLKVF